VLDVERYHAAACEEAVIAADNKLHRQAAYLPDCSPACTASCCQKSP
jgi:hypothetical protein